MKKVEIEILQYTSNTVSNTFTGNVLGNGYFQQNLLVANTKGPQTSPGNYGGQAATAMHYENPVVNNWKGYVSGDSGAINFTGEGTPCYTSGGKLYIPNEPAPGSTPGNLVTHSGVYQQVNGMTPGSQQTLQIDVHSLPSGASANDMNGIYFVIGIYGNGSSAPPPNYWESTPQVYHPQGNDPSSGNNMPHPGCIRFDFNNPLTLGINNVPFMWNNASSDGVICISVWGNTSLGGYAYQPVVLNSVQLNATQTTQYTTIDQLNGVVGRLDLTDSANFPLAMTYGVADGTNFESIFGDYSKTFQVPATKNNRKLLGYTDDEKIIDNKNISHFKDARIIVDGLEFMKGKLKLTSSSKRKSPEIFECVFYGGNADWGSQIKGKRMCDITLEKGDGSSTTPIVYGYSQIQNTWTLSPNNTDIVYPLVSYGDFYPGGTVGAVNFFDDQVINQDFRGWFYVYNLLEYIFKATGYRIESNFMQTSNGGWFKNLITQFQWAKNEEDDLSEQAEVHYRASRTLPGNENYTLTTTGAPNTNTDTGWQPVGGTPTRPGIQLSHLITDDMGQYSQDGYAGVATGKITCALDGRAKLSTQVVFRMGYWMCGNGPNYGSQLKAYIRIQKTGIGPATVGSASSTWQDVGASFSQYNVFVAVDLETDWFYTNAGDEYWLEVKVAHKVVGGITNNSTNWCAKVMGNITNPQAETFLRMEFDAAAIPINAVFPPESLLPCKTKITDFIKAIAHMFNLYFYTDVSTKTVFIEPFPNFYKSKGEALDWTNKIDWSKQIKDKYNTGLTDEVLFKYKNDSKDEYKDWLENDLNLQYPFYSWYGQFFAGGSPGITTYENPLYDGVLMNWDKDVSGYIPANRPQLIPTLESSVTVFGLNTAPNVGRPDKSFFGPKILHYKGYRNDGNTPNGSWTRQTSSTNFVTSNDFPRATFVDITDANTNFENRLNLSYNDEQHLDGSEIPGLVNLYWVDMLQQLYQKPRIRTLHLNLTINDIVSLNFRKLIYLDGTYWRLLKVLEFAPAKNQPTKIEVVQWVQTVSERILTNDSSL